MSAIRISQNDSGKNLGLQLQNSDNLAQFEKFVESKSQIFWSENFWRFLEISENFWRFLEIQNFHLSGQVFQMFSREKTSFFLLQNFLLMALRFYV